MHYVGGVGIRGGGGVEEGRRDGVGGEGRERDGVGCGGERDGIRGRGGVGEGERKERRDRRMNGVGGGKGRDWVGKGLGC